jgi:hypothetical protein
MESNAFVNVIHIATRTGVGFNGVDRQFVDQAGLKTGAESVVDIDHRNFGSATVEHAKQGGDTAETRAVTDTSGHRDNRTGNQPAHDTGKRAFHTGPRPRGL